MSEGDRQLPFPRRHLGGAPGQPLPAECLLDSEWLLTNGAGGYASGTVAGVATRRYHGLLVAALPVHGRTVMLSHLYEELRVPAGDTLHLGGEDRDGHTVPVLPPVDFCLELGLPLWRYELPGAVLEKRVLMPWGQNTVHVGYRLLSGGPLRLRLHPGLAFRPHDAPFEESLPAPYELVATHGGRYSVHSGAFPPLRLRLDGVQGSFVVHWDEATRLHHRLEADRGYRPVSALLRPGCFQVELSAAAPQATLIAHRVLERDRPGAAGHRARGRDRAPPPAAGARAGGAGRCGDRGVDAGGRPVRGRPGLARA